MITDKKIKPFLRWAGGKSWLTKDLGKTLPTCFNDYYEPFLGGGSVFFYLKNENLIHGKVFLSDLNPGLIQCYRAIRDSIDLVIRELKKYSNDADTYYLERNTKYETNFEEAARFIFLNRTSFNGIYRENLKGIYNVPYGYKKYKLLFDFDNLMRVSAALQDTELEISDFAETIINSQRGDLVFIDPPYTISHENNGFVKYNQKIFSWEDQVRLKDCIVNLEKKEVLYILTNAYHTSLLDLYHTVGSSKKLERYSVVGGNNAKREKYHELIITNIYDQENN